MFDELIYRSVDADGAGPQEAESFATVYHDGNAWADFDEAGNLIAQYLFGNGLDSNIARYRVGEGTAWYLTDHLGSIRDIIDAVGNVINHVEYDSFGNILLETNPEFGDRFKFTGREWLSELGLYYYRARFYDPVTGRFISQDPIGFFGGDQNLYGYVGNRPVTFTDPTGNVATISEVTAFELSKLGISTATGLTGFAIGFGCGVLDAYFTHDPQNGPFSFADASAGVFKQAVLGGVIGAAVGAVASTSAGAAAAPFFAQVFSVAGAALQLTEIASSPNTPSFILRVACFVAETATGAAIGRKFKRCFIAGTPVLIEQISEQEIAITMTLSTKQWLMITSGVGVLAFAGVLLNEKRKKKHGMKSRKQNQKLLRQLLLAAEGDNLEYNELGWTRLELI